MSKEASRKVRCSRFWLVMPFPSRIDLLRCYLHFSSLFFSSLRRFCGKGRARRFCEKVHKEKPPQNPGRGMGRGTQNPPGCFEEKKYHSAEQTHRTTPGIRSGQAVCDRREGDRAARIVKGRLIDVCEFKTGIPAIFCSELSYGFIVRSVTQCPFYYVRDVLEIEA